MGIIGDDGVEVDAPGIARGARDRVNWRALTMPNVREAEWYGEAACRGSDPGLFVPERGVSREEIDRAKAVCAECAVEEECLEWALRWKEAGIWGRTTRRERVRMERAQGRRAAN